MLNADKKRKLALRKKRSQRHRIAGPLMRVAPGQAEAKVPQLFLTTDLFFSHGTRFETVDRRRGKQPRG
ncbi:hypothetical protein VTI28DRAFT_9792 [Corynascus sepedonium]